MLLPVGIISFTLGIIFLLLDLIYFLLGRIFLLLDLIYFNIRPNLPPIRSIIFPIRPNLHLSRYNFSSNRSLYPHTFKTLFSSLLKALLNLLDSKIKSLFITKLDFSMTWFRALFDLTDGMKTKFFALNVSR